MEYLKPPINNTNPVPAVALSPEAAALVRRLQEEAAYASAGMPSPDISDLVASFNALPLKEQEAIDAALLAVLDQNPTPSTQSPEQPPRKEKLVVSPEAIINAFRTRNKPRLTIGQIKESLSGTSGISPADYDELCKVLGTLVDQGSIERVENSTKTIYRLLLELPPCKVEPTHDPAIIARRIGEAGFGGRVNPIRRY